MVCWTYAKPEQTAEERAREVRGVVTKVAERLTSGLARAVVGPQGAVAFLGLTDDEKAGLSDACIYRQLMATGSASAKLAIQRAEMLAGRSVSQQALSHGIHSHDGGKTWGHGH